MSTTRPRVTIPRSVRAAVLTGAVCAYCSHPGDADNPIVVDHIHPHSMGGSDDISNLQPLCSRCNTSKAGAAPGATGARMPYFAKHHFPNGVRA